jgi:hydroxyacylglutathione hydrolase
MNTKMITLDDFYQNYFNKKEDGSLFLDVRTSEEFLEGHIPGSKNVSHEQVLQHVDEIKPYEKIYIYCRRGGRAQTAAKMLQAGDLNAELYCVYDAGMDAWREKGYPEEK